MTRLARGTIDADETAQVTSFSYEVGDFDGNGQADVAIESDGAVTIMLTQ